jgi:hypothetical protein
VAISTEQLDRIGRHLLEYKKSPERELLRSRAGSQECSREAGRGLEEKISSGSTFGGRSLAGQCRAGAADNSCWCYRCYQVDVGGKLIVRNN